MKSTLNYEDLNPLDVEYIKINDEVMKVNSVEVLKDNQIRIKGIRGKDIPFDVIADTEIVE